MSTCELNINDLVTVVLTPVGIRRLHNYYMTSHAEKLEKYHLIESNIYKFQLWDLMRIFGEYMELGEVQSFVDNRITKCVKE